MAECPEMEAGVPAAKAVWERRAVLSGQPPLHPPSHPHHAVLALSHLRHHWKPALISSHSKYAEARAKTHVSPEKKTLLAAGQCGNSTPIGVGAGRGRRPGRELILRPWPLGHSRQLCASPVRHAQGCVCQSLSLRQGLCCVPAVTVTGARAARGRPLGAVLASDKPRPGRSAAGSGMAPAALRGSQCCLGLCPPSCMVPPAALDSCPPPGCPSSPVRLHSASKG